MRPAGLLLPLALAACGGLNASQGSDPMDGDAPMEVSRLGSVSPEPVVENVNPEAGVDESGQPLERRPPRPAVTSNPFRVVDLPLAVIPAPPDEGHAPRGLGGPSAPELSIETTSSDFADVRVKTSDRAVARLQIGSVESTAWDGLRVKCKIKRRTAAPARWEIL